MKKLTSIIGLFLLQFFLVSTINAANETTDPLHRFTHAFFKQDHTEMNTVLAPTVKVPEIREQTPITGMAGYPSPDQNKKVLVGRFQMEHEIQRIAFIWEVTIDKQLITDIHVVYDGSNPMVNERIIAKEFKKVTKQDILVPSYFPFEISHVDGEVDGEVATIQYQNRSSELVIQMTITSTPIPEKSPKKIKLENGFEILIKENHIIFSHNKFYYDISGNVNEKELLKFVESMGPHVKMITD